MVNRITGKAEHQQKVENRIYEILEDQPDYLTDFYISMKHSDHTSSYRTHETYITQIIRFLDYVGKPYEDIKPKDINRYIDYVSKNGRGHNGAASGSYLVQVYSAIKKFFSFLVDNDMINMTANPMLKVERPAPKKADMVNRSFLDQEEVTKCFEAIDREMPTYRERDKAILTILFSTGIRNSCLTEINVDNIDFEENSIYVVDKGTKARKCWLTPEQMDVIKKWIVLRNAYLGENSTQKALFISRTGERLNQQGTAGVVRKVSKAIGHQISPHKARGSLATIAHDNGMSIDDVASLLNHASSKTTKDCYINIKEADLKKNALKAASLINLD